MSGGGSSIGGTLGGILGTGVGGLFGGVGAPIGGALGSMAGSQIGGMLDKDADKPTVQTTPAPISNVSPEDVAMLRDIFNRRGGSVAPSGSPQGDALAAISNFRGAAEPAFGLGIEGLQNTMQGDYLDVANVPEFQNLAAARYKIGQDILGDAMNKIANRMSANNAYGSSVKHAQELEAARRVGSEAGLDVARAGFGQYANERGFMENAIRSALGLAPELAGAEFEAGMSLQAAEAAQARDLHNMLMGQIGLQQPGKTTFGPSPEETFARRTSGVTPLLSGLFSGGTGAGGSSGPTGWLSDVFGMGNKGYEGSVYYPSSGWATPGQQE